MAEARVTNTDYFPVLVAIADKDNEINTDVTNGKPLDEFLARRFSLSKPTVRALLSNWEKEGRIEVGWDMFARRILKIRILNLFARPKSDNKILLLIDWSNIWMHINVPPDKFSITAGLDRIQKQIVTEVGEIVGGFVFSPYHLASSEWEAFFQEGFYVIHCDKVTTKDGGEKNPTDEIIIEFMNDMAARMPDLTHVCLGSGDKDFCKALRKAMRRALKLMIVAGDLTSLSSELIELADVNPLTSKKMVYILSPTKDPVTPIQF